jgi:hypothetical protein
MTSTMTTMSIPLRRVDRSAGLAERMGLRLLSWAEHRRTTGPRSIDLSRIPRGDSLGRPFC